MKTRTYCQNLKCPSIGEVKACLRDYNSCTIYQKWELLHRKEIVKLGLERFLSKFPNWRFHSQQPEVLACQGEGGCTESFDANRQINSGFVETGKSTKNPSADTYLGIGAMTEVPNKYKA